MADAKKHLSNIPTEYDEDGPMPPIQEALLSINSAKEVRGPHIPLGGKHDTATLRLQLCTQQAGAV